MGIFLEPAPGFTFTVDGAGSPGFGVLGPFISGCILDRLRIYMTTITADVDVRIGAVLSLNDDANQAAFRAGRSLIQRGEVALDGKSAVRMALTTTGPSRFDVAVGLLLDVQSYVLLQWQPSAANQLMMVATVNAFRRVSFADGDGEALVIG